jgi:hypothetical protein
VREGVGDDLLALLESFGDGLGQHVEEQPLRLGTLDLEQSMLPVQRLKGPLPLLHEVPQQEIGHQRQSTDVQ